MRLVTLLRFCISATTIMIAAPAFAETGTLGNILDIPVTYQTGIPDENGNVAWQSYTIAPCETHEWSWDRGGQPNLHFIWPTWRDARKDEYGNILMQRNVVPMSNQGALTVFFPYGDQIWVDSSGGASMASCTEAAATPEPTPAPGPVVTSVEPENGSTTVAEATPTPGPSGGEVSATELLVQTAALAEAVERGEIILVEMDTGTNYRIVPIRTSDLAVAILLQSEDDMMSPEQTHDMIEALGRNSKALLETIIRVGLGGSAKN